MRVINVFVSAPIDLEDEGYEIEAFVHTLNAVYRAHDITFWLTLLEEAEPDPTIGPDTVDASEYFLILVYRHEDRRAIGLFSHAEQTFRKDNRPKLFTYFKELDEGQTSEAGVVEFMERLDRELGHFYSKFSTVDSILLDLVIEIAKDSSSRGDLLIANDKLVLDNEPLLSLGNIPSYANNQELVALKSKKSALDKNYYGLIGELSVSPTDEVEQELLNCSMQRKAVGEEIRDVEKSLLEIYFMFSELDSSTGAMAQRIQRAKEAFAAGQLEGARRILEDSEIDQERDARHERHKRMRQQFALDRAEEQEYIRGKLVLIGMLKTGHMSAEVERQIQQEYEKCLESCELYDIDPEFALDYVDYLELRNHFNRAETIGRKLYAHYSHAFEAEPTRYVRQFMVASDALAYDLDMLGGERRQEAERVYLKGIEQGRAYEQGSSWEHRKELGNLINDYGLLLLNMGRCAEAEVQLREARDIRLRLDEEKPDGSYHRIIASSLDNLALALCWQNIFSDEAEELLREALDIRLAYFDSYPPIRTHVATCYEDLGWCVMNRGRLAEAEDLQKKAISIRRELGADDHAFQILYLAYVLDDLGQNYLLQNRLAESEACLREAIGYRRAMAQKKVDSFGSYLVVSLEHLIELLEQVGNKSDEIATLTSEIEATKSRMSVPCSNARICT